VNIAKLPSVPRQILKYIPRAAKFSQPGRLTGTDVPGGRRRGRLYALAALIEQDAGGCPSPELSLLADHEAKRIVMSDAQGLQRRAENLHALAKKARDDRYIQLSDYILDRADQLFEEARIRELESSAPDDDPTLIDRVPG
jgi:hypothetical protein